MDDNLIIHGDNLHALKALLPRYAGKVKCIYIGPPYHTGNEGSCYNDNVRSPLMKEWVKNGNPVEREDMERHDKWLSMMWPRLNPLRELLSGDGAIFVSIDDNELHHLRDVLDEIFGEENFVAQIEWQKRYTRSNNTNDFTSVIEHIVVYRKSPAFQVNLLARDETANVRFTDPDNDPRGPWKATPFLIRWRLSGGQISVTLSQTPTLVRRPLPKRKPGGMKNPFIYSYSTMVGSIGERMDSGRFRI